MIDVNRSAVAPASLANKERHDAEDVLEALHRDFLGKCYLCETETHHHGELQVDHRIPVNEDKSKEFEWSNLFPTCNRFLCNQRRKQRMPVGGLLSPGDGVESRVLQHIVNEPSSRLSPSVILKFAAKDPRDIPATNTAVELERIHTGKGASVRHNGHLKARALCLAIVMHHDVIKRSLVELERFREADLAEFEKRKEELRKLLSRSAPYFMLMQSYFERIPAAREFLPSPSATSASASQRVSSLAEPSAGS